MDVLNLTLSQMLMIFSFIAVGFMLEKSRVLPDNSQTALSRLELYAFFPAMNFYNMLTRCTVSSLKSNAKYMLYGLAITLAAMLAAYPISKLFVKDVSEKKEKDYQRNIFKYALTFGNFGFMGNFIVLGIWRQDGLFKYLMFTFFPTVICNSWGLYILTPKEHNTAGVKAMLKRIFTPSVIAIILGIGCGILDLQKYFPEFIISALSNASACMGPVAMLLSGIAIGKYKFKELISVKRIYAVTALRLIFIPAVILLILKVIGTEAEIVTLALIAFAAPLGLNTVVFPAAYGGNVKIGASMAFVSHLLSVITVPVMYYLFIELM